MANKILPFFDTAASGVLSITLTGLASSTAGVGQQSTMLINTGTRYKRIRLYSQITLGNSPTANKGVYFYALRGDNNGFRTDNASGVNTGISILNADPIGVMSNTSTVNNTALYKDMILEDPGPEWGVAVTHDTVASLNMTGALHFIRYIGEEPEVQ